MRKLLLIVTVLFCAGLLSAQVDTNDDLYKIIKEKDSLLFDLGYNKVDSLVLKEITSENFEMYHDQSGIINSKQRFIQAMKGLGTMSYKARRELVPGSLEVYPLRTNGKLYGAIQFAEHRFYAKYVNKAEFISSEAKLTVLWILENDEWKLTRALSYDHKSDN